MKIYRSILLNEGEEINTENLGCSWTLCEIFAEDHAKDINGHLGKDGFVILQAEVSKDDIDWSNTLHAMEERENEFEVVVMGDIKATVKMVDGHLNYEQDDIIEGNAGDNTFEDYYDNYDGDFTIEDFINLANEF